MTYQEILVQVLSLPVDDRLELMEALRSSLPTTLSSNADEIPPLSPEWEAEISRRLDDHLSGRAKGIPAKEALDRLYLRLRSERAS